MYIYKVLMNSELHNMGLEYSIEEINSCQHLITEMDLFCNNSKHLQNTMALK